MESSGGWRYNSICRFRYSELAHLYQYGNLLTTAIFGSNIPLVGFLLPLASGSAPASKGVLTEMVPSHRRPDALQAMTLVEYMATFSTLGIFGAIFSALADVGKSYMTFYCNAVGLSEIHFNITLR